MGCLAKSAAGSDSDAAFGLGGRLAVDGVRAPRFEDAWLAQRCEIAYGLCVWLLNDNAFQTETANTALAAGATTAWACCAGEAASGQAIDPRSFS